jgi:DNA-binding beta-propeller fold protein YncE
LTTHLTTPLILIAGWVVGQLLTRIHWQHLFERNAWSLFALIPLFIVALLRTAAPVCNLWPANPLCNTVIPISYQVGVLAGKSTEALAASGVWFAALIVLIGTLIAIFVQVRKVGVRLLGQLVLLFIVSWLTFLTARTAWTAAFINYDDANEYLVYAHSAGAVKDVLDQIAEISHKTTDGLGLRVAYDNRVSWPMSWYFRDYYNAVYFGDQPSRGLIGDAPVILAGPSNWPKVESIIGDRYYQFEYIRMWWPMQDYFDLKAEDFRNVLRDPALQRGIWEIFMDRDYSVYADAVAVYRPNNTRPNFELSQWPVSERMRLYIRKDIFAQVWDYGVAASEIAESVDPYAENAREMVPADVWGQDLLNRPHGIDVGPDGQIYVADSNNHRILVFDAQGHVSLTFGEYGLAPATGVLNEPWDVAVAPDGSIFVADTWNHRVVKYTAEGQFVSTWGSEGPNQTSPNSFWGPRGIDVDSDGQVYVADTGNKRVMVYDGDGNFIRQIGSGGSFDGELDEPAGIAAADDGMVYVADTWNQRIQVFTREGLFIRGWSVEAWFAQSNERPYLDVDTLGNLYVTDPDASRVIVFNTLGQYLYSFGDIGSLGIGGGVAVDDSGNLYVTDTENGALQRYLVDPTAGLVE